MTSTLEPAEKLLRGKYKKLIAVEARADVEHHYNHGMTPYQRRAFKALVKSIFRYIDERAESPGDIDETKVIEANAILEANAKGLIAAPYRFHVVAWLATASLHQKQCFRDTLCKVRGLHLFNGKSETKTSYAPELITNTAELVRRRELEHMMRAQRATELLALYASSNGTGTSPAHPTMHAATKAVVPVRRPLGVVQKAHESSVHGAPWGTLFLPGDLRHIWRPTTLDHYGSSTYDTHGKPMQNYNENYANMELSRYRKRVASASVPPIVRQASAFQGNEKNSKSQ